MDKTGNYAHIGIIIKHKLLRRALIKFDVRIAIYTDTHECSRVWWSQLVGLQDTLDNVCFNKS